MKYLVRGSLLLVSLSLSSWLMAQQPIAQQQDDAQAAQPTENVDVVAEIQQLKADIERLNQQVEQLSNDVQRLQKARPTTTRTTVTRTPPTTATATTSPVPSPSATPSQPEQTPVTDLVFKDGRRVETRNYAIVGESIWIYTEQESKRYRLADLDVDGTKKLNSDHGVPFQLPPSP